MSSPLCASLLSALRNEARAEVYTNVERLRAREFKRQVYFAMEVSSVGCVSVEFEGTCKARLTILCSECHVPICDLACTAFLKQECYPFVVNRGGLYTEVDKLNIMQSIKWEKRRKRTSNVHGW